MKNFKNMEFPFDKLVNHYTDVLQKPLNELSESVLGIKKDIPLSALLQLFTIAKSENPLKTFNIDGFHQKTMMEKLKYHIDHFDKNVVLYELQEGIDDHKVILELLSKNHDIIQEIVLFSHFLIEFKQANKNGVYDTNEKRDKYLNLHLARFLSSVRGKDSTPLDMTGQAIIRRDSKSLEGINPKTVTTLTQLPSRFLQVLLLLSADRPGAGFTLTDIDKRIDEYCKNAELTRAERKIMKTEFRDNLDNQFAVHTDKGYESGPLFVQIAENIITGEKRYIINPALAFGGAHFLDTTMLNQLAKFREAFQGRSLKLTSNFFSLYFWIVSTIHSNGGENIALKTSTLSKLIIYLPLTGKNGAQNLKTLNEHLDIIKSCCPEIGISFTAANNKLIRIDLSENKRNISRSVKS